MPTSNATIVQCAMTGYRITCSTRSSRFRTSLHAGSGRTIMNGQTWPWVVSRHDRSWPWWPDSTSEPRYKWGDYRGTYLRRSVLQSLERGARAVGVDAYFNAMAINADSDDPVFPGGLVEVCPDIAGAVGELHAQHKPRCESGVYGVEAIDLQVQIGCPRRCAQNDKTGQEQAADTRRAERGESSHIHGPCDETAGRSYDTNITVR